MAKLYIAIYKPIEGNYEHWALFLDDGGDKTVFEVVGQHPTFARNIIKVDPSDSRRHKKNIPIATINKVDIPALQLTMEAMHIDNETVHWNCQDYVLEALDKLFEECIIDEDDEDYKKNRKRVVRDYYGPK